VGVLVCEVVICDCFVWRFFVLLFLIMMLFGLIGGCDECWLVFCFCGLGFCGFCGD